MIRARGERDLAERDSRDARDELSHVREKLEKSLRGDLLERSEKEQELAQICARLTESLSECAQKKEKAEKDAREYHAELQELKSALPEGAFASPMMQSGLCLGRELLETESSLDRQSRPRQELTSQEQIPFCREWKRLGKRS
jgi:SMC interacting uncharacterized protein involved in chromosome segregation